MKALTFRDAYSSNKFRGTEIDLSMYSLLLSGVVEDHLIKLEGWQFENLMDSDPNLLVFYNGDTVVKLFLADRLMGIGKQVETLLPDSLEQFIVLYRLAQKVDPVLPDLEWGRATVETFLPAKKAA